MSINMLNVCKYFKALPHQVKALELLQEQLEANHQDLIADTAEWVSLWRSGASSPVTKGRNNLKAFLLLIRHCEGTLGDIGYRTIYTYRYFSSFQDHPRLVMCSNGLCSDAAGAYQFLSTTWDSVARALGLSDFSPPNQDKAAIELIRRRGALEYVQAGQLWGALERCSWEWASLPPNRYGQPSYSYDECERLFIQYGGQLDDF